MNLASPETYEKYLNVSFIHKTFEPDTWTTYAVVPSGPCTDEQIARHFPLSDPKNSWNQEVWLCPDLPEDFEVYGEFNSWSSSYFEIWVEKCNNDTSAVVCATEEEIIDFLVYKYIVVRMNMQNFAEMDMDYFITNSTDEHWIPIHFNTPARYNFLMSYEEIEREDEFM
eukprot:CAMPEP_0116872480 /NCGR_PEP_ID=MMETSP0463-20121206/3244_1 /TAXON_ID=181622 /ORGANISM="Strombidinopsis sp, Strain SopsisLIS2011" /LENGTH=168 /DNA_ID=CAMNT_0004512771 /DNA_START=254 /DNA_END=760 /DNA_ORIENTATION=+